MPSGRGRFEGGQGGRGQDTGGEAGRGKGKRGPEGCGGQAGRGKGKRGPEGCGGQAGCGKGKGKGKRQKPTEEEALEVAGDERVAVLDEIRPTHITAPKLFNMLPQHLWERLIFCSKYAQWGVEDAPNPHAGDKDAFLPALSCVFQPASGVRLWIGGSVAADSAAVLKRNGIRAKCCIAGTMPRLSN